MGRESVSHLEIDPDLQPIALRHPLWVQVPHSPNNPVKVDGTTETQESQ